MNIIQIMGKKLEDYSLLSKNKTIISLKDLDRTDQAIIKALQENARLSNVELSNAINLSPSACLRRVANLEKSGIIKGYHAELNAQQLGFDVTILVQVTLDGQSALILSEFEQEAMKIPNVLACFLMAGAKDYIIRIAARDVADYGDIHTNHLSNLPHVRSIESNFVLRTVTNRNLPLGINTP
jgi:DNA-binding Lrp family transcriptional regulator